MTISASVTGSILSGTATSWRPAAAVSSSTITATVTPVQAPTVPGAPTIVSAAFDQIDTSVTITAPESNGGSPITLYVFYFDGVDTPPDLIEPLGPGTYRFDGSDYSGQELEVSAVNAIGEGPKSAPFTVTA